MTPNPSLEPTRTGTWHMAREPVVLIIGLAGHVPCAGARGSAQTLCTTTRFIAARVFSKQGTDTSMRIEAKKRRAYWVAELEKLSGSFGDDSARMIAELQDEISKSGVDALADHLRVCGAMPEQYGHDSSAEKLYSKYTDAVISETLTAIG